IDATMGPGFVDREGLSHSRPLHNWAQLASRRLDTLARKRFERGASFTFGLLRVHALVALRERGAKRPSLILGEERNNWRPEIECPTHNPCAGVALGRQHEVTDFVSDHSSEEYALSRTFRERIC